MKPKILYLNFCYDVGINPPNGIFRKILNQKQAFEALGYDVVLTAFDCREDSFSILGTSYKMFHNDYCKILRPRYRYKIVSEYLKENKIDILYIRSMFGTGPSLLRLLKEVKKNNLQTKIIFEIPTYPYDNEVKKINSEFVSLQIGKIFRRFLYKYIDYIVTFTRDEKIFNIECINISNGINLEEITERTEHKRTKDKIVFTSVSAIEEWHGVDRFIKSMEAYLQTNTDKLDIIFNVVGPLDKASELIQYTNSKAVLKDRIVFHGFLTPKELEKIYNETDIAVGSLGIHRIGLSELQPLKNREYCAKGLPFIIGFNDIDFEKEPFVYKVKGDESLINISNIISWYNQLIISTKDIRKFSEQFSWDRQMKKVIDRIK